MITRWDSTYFMLTSIQEAHSTLLLIDDSALRSLLEQLDLDLLENLAQFLKHFLDARVLLSGEEDITLPLVIPVKRNLKQFIEKSFFEQEIKEEFLSALETKIPITTLHKGATFLYGIYFHQLAKSQSPLFTIEEEFDIENLFEVIIQNSPKSQPKALPQILENPSLDFSKNQANLSHPSFILDQIMSVEVFYSKNASNIISYFSF